MDHGSVGLAPRIYGVRDYVEADPAAKKNSPYKEMASWESTCHLPWFSVSREQSCV